MTIANPVDSLAFSPNLSREEAKSRLGLPISTQVIGTACRFAPEKDLALFLNVAFYIAASDRQVAFLMVGAGVELAALQQRVEELKLQHLVRFTGIRTDMPTVWRGLDIYLFTSAWSHLAGQFWRVCAVRPLWLQLSRTKEVQSILSSAAQAFSPKNTATLDALLHLFHDYSTHHRNVRNSA